MTKSAPRRKFFRTSVRGLSRLNDLIINSVQSLSDEAVEYRYLKETFLSKYCSEETAPPEVRRQRAINKWLATERINEATNDRILTTPEDYQILPRVQYCHFVDKVREIIANILGDVPPFDILIGSFSGGASTSRVRTSSHPAEKFLGKADVTLSAETVFLDLLDEMPLWNQCRIDTESYLNIVPGNVLFTVPKNHDIDRCACKEPDINMFMQKGIGESIRRRLRHCGIDLNDQSINRNLAREGSINGLLATVDLSSASDSVSYQLVAELLPFSWFTLLDSVRSPITRIDDYDHVNAMFSSMGNGFTFELESLIFYSLARAAAYFTGTKGVISVYGDDIIIPTSLYHDFRFVLEYFGFSVNTDKSFYEGPFRESCGGHYHNGRDITPFYLRAPLRDLTDVIHIANQIRLWSERIGLTMRFSRSEIGVLDPALQSLWESLAGVVPQVLWGANEPGRDALITHHHPRKRLVREKRTIDTGLGGYLHWHSTLWKRSTDSFGSDLVLSERSKELSRFRIRPQPKWAGNSVYSYFPGDLGVA